jgi:NTE family protein
MECSMAVPPAKLRYINLALQGGGSHGAFTWGVLDRLLEDETIDIEAISGTSAGAMNAVAVASGYATGGREGAKATLAQLWQRIAEASPFRFFTGPWADMVGFENNPMFLGMEMMSRFMSPYQFNPTNINTLRDIIDDLVDWQAVRASSEFKLFLSATNVRTGRVKIFEQKDICPDRVMASACLPQLFHAVEVDGEHYWDGGYMGNPALFPLYYATQSSDILIIAINPLYRPSLPQTARDISDRVNEISFNSSLLQDLRAIDFVTRLLDDNKLDAKQYRRMLVHMIATNDEIMEMGPATKYDTSAVFLEKLRSIGYRCTDQWIAEHGHKLGKHSSVDLHGLVNGI